MNLFLWLKLKKLFSFYNAELFHTFDHSFFQPGGFKVFGFTAGNEDKVIAARQFKVPEYGLICRSDNSTGAIPFNSVTGFFAGSNTDTTNTHTVF